jgi:hypothetical protein
MPAFALLDTVFFNLSSIALIFKPLPHFIVVVDGEKALEFNQDNDVRESRSQN